jgi:hypothetical protein
VPTRHPPATPQPTFHAPKSSTSRLNNHQQVTPPVVPLGFSSNHPPHTNGVDRMVLPHTQQVRVTVLLRKEVIQPHLPVRLPCYDFVPIASPTFDHSPPHGLGHGLRVLPTFVT